MSFLYCHSQKLRRRLKSNFVTFFFFQDGNGKVSRVIRMGTRKSQVMSLKLSFIYKGVYFDT